MLPFSVLSYAHQFLFYDAHYSNFIRLIFWRICCCMVIPHINLNPLRLICHGHLFESLHNAYCPFSLGVHNKHYTSRWDGYLHTLSPESEPDRLRRFLLLIQKASLLFSYHWLLGHQFFLFNFRKINICYKFLS